MKEKAATRELYKPAEVTYTSRGGQERKAAYEHPFAVRFTHWLNLIALIVMAGSGLRIYLAFPAFGDKVPPKDFFRFPEGFSLGGWLAGALQWHFTFMWLFVAAGAVYLAYELITGNWRQVIFTRNDVRGLWPMFRHYFLFGPKPEQSESYNSLQKLAYTGTILLGVLSTLTGLILYKSAQLSFLVPLLGGYRSVRVLHALSLVGFGLFVPGHLVMVVVHGWNNFQSMLTGWNFNPVYAIGEPLRSTPEQTEIKPLQTEPVETTAAPSNESELNQADIRPSEDAHSQQDEAQKPEDTEHSSSDEPGHAENQ